MARIRKKEKLKPVLFIACEGTNTEYDYFNTWAQLDSVLDIYGAVNVYPSDGEESPKTTPYQLFEIASEALKNGSADFAWAVFDRDNHPKLRETFAEGQAAGVNIAFSSRSFEEWVLMHFEKNNITFSASECKSPEDKDRPLNCGTKNVQNCAPVACLSGHIRRRNFIPNYSKKKVFDLFAAIFNYSEKAIVNAAWLRFQSNASLNLVQPELQALNPYTDVDQLILKLQERSDKIEWGILGTDIHLSFWKINVAISSGNIVLRLSHKKPQAQVLNANFFQASFFTTDDELNGNNCNVIGISNVSNANGSNNHLLYPGDIVEFTLHSNCQPYFLFRDDSLSVRIYVVL